MFERHEKRLRNIYISGSLFVMSRTDAQNELLIHHLLVLTYGVGILAIICQVTKEMTYLPVFPLTTI